MRARVLGRPPVPGQVRFGDLRRPAPLSRWYGLDRGLPVDRYYIEDFLSRHSRSPGYGAGDFRGRVMEVGGDEYTRRFGASEDGSPAVERIDVLHVDSSNPKATVVGDLASGEGVPSEEYDCIVCTQTLHVVFDVRGAIASLHRALKPGGVLLATVAGISQTCRPDRDLWGDYWRFTSLSARRLFEERFPPEGVTVEAYGNVLAASAFLYGIAAGELRTEELDVRDPDYEMLVAIRAVKGAP